MSPTTIAYALQVLLINLVISSAQQVDVWTTDARSENPKDRLRLTKRLLFQADKSSGEYVVDVNEQTVYQTIDGFGVTLSDSSAWLLWNKLSALRREQLLRYLFDSRLGIGLNAVRISIGASDFATSNYTYDDTCCDLSDFNINHDKQYIIPILKTIKKWNPDLIIIGMVWSPPAWMKINNSTVGGKLKRDEYSNFATYLTKYVQAYQKEGLFIHGVVIQNQPVHRSCCYPSMSMDAREQAYIIKTKLGPVFKKYKLNTRILIYGQEWEKVDYPLEVLEDEDVKRHVGGTAFTCYGGTAQHQTQVHMLYPEQDIWLIECSDGTWKYEGQFKPLFTNSISEDLVKPLRNYARGILKANLILNQDYGPTNEGCKGCFGMVTLNEITGNITYNSAYYAFGHLSKFVRSAARRIQSSTFTNNLDTIAFLNPDGTKILLVSNKDNITRMFKVQWGNVSFSYSLEPSTAATFTWKGRQSRKLAYERVEAESYSYQQGTELESCTDSSGCGDNVAQVDSGDYLKYENMDFGDTGITSIAIRYASRSTKTGLLELRLDALDGKFIGLLQLKPTGGWQKWVTITDRVRTVTGVRDLYLVFRGGDPAVGNINWFCFNRTPNRIPSNIVVNENAVYKIVAMKSDKVLEVPVRENAKSSGLQLANFANQGSQKFIFRSMGNECYKIGVKNSFGLVLGYETNSDTNNARIVQVPDRDGLNQRWRLEQAKDGYVQIVSCTNGKAWSLEGPTLNSPVHLSSVTADKDQTFSIVNLELYANSHEVSQKYWRRE